MEARHDRPASHFPRCGIGGDETLPHDGFQDFCQDSLVICLCVVAQDMSDHHRVGDDDEGLGAKAELVRRPELSSEDAPYARVAGVRLRLLLSIIAYSSSAAV